MKHTGLLALLVTSLLVSACGMREDASNFALGDDWVNTAYSFADLNNIPEPLTAAPARSVR